jgi:hypothetical protein
MDLCRKGLRVCEGRSRMATVQFNALRWARSHRFSFVEGVIGKSYRSSTGCQERKDCMCGRTQT